MHKPLFILLLSLLFAACGDSDSPGADTLNQGPGVPDPCVLVPAKAVDANAHDSVFANDFGQLISCGLLDDFDVLYLVPNLIPEVQADAMASGKDTITYQMLIDRVRRFKLTGDYAMIKSRMRQVDSLRNLPVNLVNWTADTAMLSKLGMTPAEMQVLRKTAEELLKKNPNLRWDALLDSTDARLQRTDP